MSRPSPTKNEAKGQGNKKATQGAVQSRTGFGDISRSYWAHHRSSLIDSFQRLVSTPVQTLMTALVVAIALALPVTLLLALDNVTTMGESWDSNPKISVFLNVRAKQAAIDSLIEEVRGFDEVASVQFLSPDEALADFQTFSGFGEVLQSLSNNPLPPTLIVSPKPSMMEPQQLEILSKRLGEQGIVEEVSMDMDWVRRLQEIMLLGRKIVLALASLLSVGVLLAIGNTIRLAIENRRDEILVTKLVGGTDGFVRRPFLYSGGWYGLFGGVLACVIVFAGYATIHPSVQRLVTLYQSDFELQGLGLATGMQLLLISTALGWIGSWIAVGRHLSQIEPK